MKTIKVLLILTLVTAFPYAGNSQITDDKVKALAADLCQCMKPIKDSLSAEAIDLLVKASESANPDSALQTAFEKMDEGKKMTLAMDLMKLAALEDDEHEVTKCMNGLQTKYPDYADDNIEFMERLIKAFDGMNDCKLISAFMKIGLASKKAGGEEE